MKPFSYIDYLKQVHLPNCKSEELLVHKFPITFEQFLNWQEFSDFDYSLDFDDTGENYGNIVLPKTLTLVQLENQFVYEFPEVGISIALEFELVDFSVHTNAVFVKHDIHVCKLITGSKSEFVCEDIILDIAPNYITNMTPIPTELKVEDKPVMVVLSPVCDFDSLPNSLQMELSHFVANV